MKKSLFLAVAILLMLPNVRATNPWGAISKLALSHYRESGQLRSSQSSPETFQAFIAVDDVAAIDALRQCGVKVSATFDGYVTAVIPSTAIDKIATVPGVNYISLARPLHLCNDTARYLTGIDAVQMGRGMITPLSGKGVIVGIIDVGIDFNHVNFLDNEGKTRVCAVYMPNDFSGTPPVIDGDTLIGSCYETPELIAALTSDYTSTSHGTHTTGTAAGGYKANGWYGMAPEADIVACGVGMDDITDVAVANSVRYIFDYADRVGKPCVINMSIGSNEGPNDGSSFLCRTFASMTGPGRICVLSAGNDGDAPICLHASLDGDTVTALLRHTWSSLLCEGGVSMWSDGPQVHRTRLVVFNRQTGALEYASPFFGVLPGDSVVRVDGDVDEHFGELYTGYAEYASAFEPQFGPDGAPVASGRFHSVWTFDAVANEKGHALGLQFVCDEGVNLTGWSQSSSYFSTFDLPGVTDGSIYGSISDMATTDSVISVGAYYSHLSYVDAKGDSHLYPGTTGEIASFSSYGPDEHGISRPDVCAPGSMLLSSANRYDAHATRIYWPTPVVVDGQEYPYYANQGTSMSAPVVTGAIALMLQLNPHLGPSDVREVLRNTSAADSYVTEGIPERWGFGKLDAAAAVNYLIDNTLMKGDVNNDGEVNIADINAVIDIILSGRSAFDGSTLVRADFNRDLEINIADVNCIIDVILK